MDNIHIAIGLAVAVVLVLVYVYWANIKQKLSSMKKETFHNKSESIPVATAPPAESDWGRGVVNNEEDARYKKITTILTGYDDYNSVAQAIALEPEVFESHNNYAKDLNHMNLGPSNLSERSDPNDIIKWVGLRRPDYASTYADDSARQTHSESPDQMYKQTGYII